MRTAGQGRRSDRLAYPAIGLAVALLAVPASATDMFGDDYKPCGDQASTPAIVDCIAAKTKIWDKRLNKAYAELLGSVGPDRTAGLRSAQRLWVHYRDANCAFYASHEGTISHVLGAECLHAMTRDRAQEIEDAMKP